MLPTLHNLKKGRTGTSNRFWLRHYDVATGSAAAAVFGGLLIASAPNASAQTLTQALAEAYNTNPQLLAQRALLRATDEQVPQALSGWRPTVNFTGQVGGNRGAFTSTLTSGKDQSEYSTFFSNSVNLQVTQSLYSGGRTVAQTRQAMNTVDATRAQTLAIETSVFQAVAMAYLDVVRDQASGRGRPQQRPGSCASSSKRPRTAFGSAR